MSTFKYFSIILLSVFLVNCGGNPSVNSSGLTVKTSAKNNKATIGETVKLSLNNPNGVSVSSLQYLLDGKPVTANLTLNSKLGKQNLVAQVISDGDTLQANSNLVVVNNKTPDLYTYEIVNTYPHDITSYTQGLEFYKSELYESTGQFGESKLRKVDYKTGEVLKNLDLKSG